MAGLVSSVFFPYPAEEHPMLNRLEQRDKSFMQASA